MDVSLNQPRRVEEEGPMDRKLLLDGANSLLYANVKVPSE
jgi:hypothetical protein